VFLVRDLWAYAAVGGFLLFSVLFSRVPPLKVLRSVKGILFVVLFTAALNVFYSSEGKILWQFWRLRVTDSGLLTALRLALRLIFLVAGTSLLTFTTTPTGITDGMESLMKPLKVVRFPVHDIALIMSIALRFIPILMEETDKIMMAQKARGASFDTGGLVKRAKALLPVLIPLFVSAFRRADELALALDARCYRATPKRTKLKELKFGWRDFLAFFLTAGYIVLIVAVNNSFWL
jgi:energy-coupling factor transport system permease protein